MTKSHIHLSSADFSWVQYENHILVITVEPILDSIILKQSRERDVVIHVRSEFTGVEKTFLYDNQSHVSVFYLCDDKDPRNIILKLSK